MKVVKSLDIVNEYIEKLEQENKQLKEEIETLKDDIDFNLGAIENIRKENHKLEEKIDEAIEYIYEDIKANYFKRYDDEVYKMCDDLLEILGGNKEND